jgi:FkbM family methyltransferase|tara:strand:- start:283 stop:1041 length:759 start_codon:yes stop_codon:yes gene_type:complete
MRIKYNKELEFLFKKVFFSEKYLLRKRLERAIKKNYEEELLILNKIVSKDLESVDVGVYRGVYTYKLSKISKHVHSFEPNPLIFPYLDKNLKKILKNMTLYNIALSDKKSEVDLKIPKRSKTINKKNYEERYKLGCATIHKDNSLINEEFITLKVKTSKLDDLLTNKKIGFIKIDVEGHEKKVLMGSANIIKKYKPNLLVEIEERHSKVKVENTINFINELGYKSYFFNGSDISSTKTLKDFNLRNNYIFIP